MGGDSPVRPPDSPDDNYEDENASVLYGRLTVEGGAEGAEDSAQFDVYGGENRIGRDPDECNIVIHNKVGIG